MNGGGLHTSFAVLPWASNDPVLTYKTLRKLRVTALFSRAQLLASALIGVTGAFRREKRRETIAPPIHVRSLSCRCLRRRVSGDCHRHLVNRAHLIALSVPGDLRRLPQSTGVVRTGGQCRLSSGGLPRVFELHPGAGTGFLNDRRVGPVGASIGADLDPGDPTPAGPGKAANGL